MLLGVTVTFGADRFVSLTGGHAAPFTDWASAATNIQAAIDVADAGDVVWVTNGIYNTGGKVMAGDLTNRVVLDKALTVRSVNGPFATFIEGAWDPSLQGAGPMAVRCAWLTNGAVLQGFTLQRGATRSSGDPLTLRGGGAVWCWTNGVIDQCVIRSNIALVGHAVYRGQIRNSLITQNSKSSLVGGYVLQEVTLNNCTVVSNWAQSVFGPSQITNCIIYYNSRPDPLPGNATIAYSCTASPSWGVGNISADPQFLPGTFDLSVTSPCRDAGLFLGGGTDLEGRPWANPPSMGCLQWQPTPIFIQQPRIEWVTHSTAATISSVVDGQQPIACWWLRNGQRLEDGVDFDATQTTNLLVRNVPLMVDASFQMVASNAFGVVTSAVVQLAVHYANAASSAPFPPYNTWQTAATNIQDAINAAAPGSLVLVTNGIYNTGGKVMAGDLTNRVAVNKPLLLQSVNGPEVTVIQGQWDPTTTNGPLAVRCAWLTNGATLNGFTLRGGATRALGDVETLRSGGGVWAASETALVTNCIITGNSANQYGGGAYSGFLSHCTFTMNNAAWGGGAAGALALNCLVTDNRAVVNGGGLANVNATNCAITRNFAVAGGGGVSLSGMTMLPAFTQLQNCTITENVSITGGGGLYLLSPYGPSVVNCIIWNNRGSGLSPDYSPSNAKLSYCCVSTLPFGTGVGPGNISVDPQLLADGIHLAATSPCRGAGFNSVVGTDWDGQPWLNPPSIGCDEPHPAPLAVAIQPRPSPQVGQVKLRAVIAGTVGADCAWLKDGVVLENNSKYATAHTSELRINEFNLADAGYYQLVASNAFGVSTSQVLHVTVHCVDAAGNAPQPPFATWNTAAPDIQAAIDVAAPGAVILVTNGVYATGSRATTQSYPSIFSGLNRVVLDKAVLVTSVNGPQVTTITGQWPAVTPEDSPGVRCVWMARDSGLSGFTLTGGAGGVWCDSQQAELANCAITNCNDQSWAGGAYGGTLRNCILVDNIGSGVSSCQVFNSLMQRNQGKLGGGAAYSFLQNCTVTANTAATGGGGVYSCELVNSIVYFNSAPSSPEHVFTTGINSCSSAPFFFWSNNITADPQLIDGWHLALNSPCRGAGNPLYVTDTDLDGDPWTNPPSIGCDEVVAAAFVGPLTVAVHSGYPDVAATGKMPLIGEITGLPSRVDWTFGDGTGATNASFLVYHSWTEPGDYLVTLTAYNLDHSEGVTGQTTVTVIPALPVQMLAASAWSGTNFSLSFTGQLGFTYTVEQTTNLAPPVTWQTWKTLPGTAGLIELTDPGATNAMRFYRLRRQ